MKLVADDIMDLELGGWHNCIVTKQTNNAQNAIDNVVNGDEIIKCWGRNDKRQCD